MSKYFKGEEKAIFDAVWEWVKDHSDIKTDGQLFLKAHINTKDSFRRSIRFRMDGFFRDVLDKDLEIANRKNEATKKMIANNLKTVEIQNRKAINKKNIFSTIKKIFA